jgi:hypothetical protein
MPVILKIEHPGGQRTAIWEITEDEYSLLQIASLDKAGVHALSLLINPGRRLEWLAVRALLKQFYPSSITIDYLENGKPLLVNNTDKISISHSGKMVSIALHPHKNPGIDIEILRPRILNIADRFLAEPEKTHLGLTPSIEQLTIMWGAKEVMFKVYGQNGISFKNDFEIKPFALALKGKLEGLIHKGSDNLVIPMEYIRIKDFILVQTDYL